MKNLRRMCGATVLTCVLAVAVSAGDMLTPGVTAPPPPPPAASVMVTLLQALLSVL